MGITACQSCGMQFDTTQYAPGVQFQCTSCGAVVTVPGPQAGAPQGRAPAGRAPAGQARQPAHQQRGPTVQRPAPQQRVTNQTGYAQQQAAGYGAPGFSQQPAGYGAPGYSQQPPGYGQAPGFGVPVQKKSNTGLVVGLCVGIGVLLVIVVLVFSLGGGGLSPADQTVLDRVLRFEPARPAETRLTPQEVADGTSLRDRGRIPADKVREFDHKLNTARSYNQMAVQNERAQKVNSLRDQARREVQAVERQFFTALGNGDVDTIRGLIDEREFLANVRGRGTLQTRGEVWVSPLTHNYKQEIYPDAQGVRQFKLEPDGPRPEGEILSVGLKVVVDLFKGTRTEQHEFKNKDKTAMEIFGMPAVEGIEESARTSHYHALYNYRIPGFQQDLQVAFGGTWDSLNRQGACRVLFIYDKSANDYRDVKYKEAERAGLLQDDTMMGGDRYRSDPSLPGNQPAVHYPEDFVPPLYNEQEVARTGRTSGDIKMVEVIQNKLSAGARANAEDVAHFKSLGLEEKLRTLDHMVDMLLNIAARGESQEERVIPVVSMFLVDALKDQPLNIHWTESVTFERGASPTKGVVWAFKVSKVREYIAGMIENQRLKPDGTLKE
jgi:hypothetical protein